MKRNSRKLALLCDLLGYAEELLGVNFAASVMGSATNLTDWQTIIGGLLATLPDQERFDEFEKEKLSAKT